MNKHLFIWLGCIAFLLLLDPAPASATEIIPQQPEPAQIEVIKVEKNSITHEPDFMIVAGITRYTTLDSTFSVPINDYVADVLSIEISGAAFREAKQAQAVAIRNYIWNRAQFGNNSPIHPCVDTAYYGELNCDVTDSTLDQAFVPGNASDYDKAVVANTKNYVLVWNNEGTPTRIPSFTRYGRAHRGPFTDPAPNTNHEPYNMSVYDPIADLDTYNHLAPGKAGDGIGLAQEGAIFYNQGRHSYLNYSVPTWNTHQILAHYYTSAELLIRQDATSNVYQDTVWGDDRMNVVTHRSLTPATDGYYFTGSTINIEYSVQNTGVHTWAAGTQLSINWARKKAGAAWEFIDETLVPIQLAPGKTRINSTLALVIPTNLYAGSDYTYYLWWDLRMPDGLYISNTGWFEQLIPINIQKKPATPKPAPAPPTCPGRRPCPIQSPTVTITWPAVEHPDPLTYVWRNTANGSGGTTTATTVEVPLTAGTNTIEFLTYITDHPNVGSSWTPPNDAALVFYDPLAPHVTLTPQSSWTNASSVQLNWTATDPEIVTQQGQTEPGSGVVRYMLERQIDGGTWETLIDDQSSLNYTQTGLTNNTHYSFRLSVTDDAGNVTIQTRTISVDHTAPTSLLTVPVTDTTTTKTWLVVAWTGDDGIGSGIDFYSIDYRVPGQAWQPWRSQTYGTRALFQGQAYQTYELRIRAVDRAGNRETAHLIPDTRFTLGADSSGLTQLYLPRIQTP